VGAPGGGAPGATAAPGRTPIPASRIFSLGWPLALGMGGHAAFNLVDLWIVGPLGAPALAAMGVAALLNTVPMVIMQGVSDASVSLIGRATGAGDPRGAAAAARQSILLALALSVVLGVPPALAARPLAAAFTNGPPSEETVRCVAVLSAGSGTMFLLLQATAVLRALGGAAVPAGLLVGANLLNVVAAWALVHGRLGLPACGVEGAAWATVGARGVFAVAGLALLRRPPLGLRWRGEGPRAAIQGRLLRLGVPVAGQWLVRLAAVLALLAVAGRGGDAAVAGFVVAGRLEQLVLFSTVGWGSAASTAVAQGIGAGDPAGAARAAWRAVLLGSVTMAAAAAIYGMFAGEIVGIFARGPDGGAPAAVVEEGALYLRRACLGYPAVGAAVVLSLALTGAGSVRTSLALDAVVLLGVQAPLAWALVPADGGLAPAWWVVAGTYGVLGAGYAAAFASGRWKRRAVADPP
jgi:putative MATE family efflux protein